MSTTTKTFVTVAEFLAALQIARSTFDDWRAKGLGPRWIKLPNGQLRCRRSEFERWLDSLEGAA